MTWRNIRKSTIALKLGIPTSSNFHKIITPQGKPWKQWREYACVLIAKRLLQQKNRL